MQVQLILMDPLMLDPLQMVSCTQIPSMGSTPVTPATKPLLYTKEYTNWSSCTD